MIQARGQVLANDGMDVDGTGDGTDGGAGGGAAQMVEPVAVLATAQMVEPVTVLATARMAEPTTGSR